MSKTQCTEQLQLFEVGRQQVRMTFDGGQIVSDAGLLPIRELDQKLGFLAKAARRLPDPRTEKAVPQYCSARMLLGFRANSQYGKMRILGTIHAHVPSGEFRLPE